MPRKAFVGLSSPIFYDYRNPASRAPGDLQSSPNPILDGAYGLFILFDEVWFLTRSLCPENLRKASFVHFLDEERVVPTEVFERQPDAKNFFTEHQIKNYGKVFDQYQVTVRKVGVDWKAGADNHSHGIKVGNAVVRGNSADESKVVKDIMLMNELGDDSMVLVTNTFTQRLFDPISVPTSSHEIADVLILNHLPNHLTPEGPFHPCIEEIRQSKYLIDFRKWVASHPGKLTERERANICGEAESQIRDHQKKILDKYWDPKRQYKSLAKCMLSFVPGLSLPLKTLGLEQQRKEIRKVTSTRWQGLLLDVEAIAASKRSDGD